MAGAASQMRTNISLVASAEVLPSPDRGPFSVGFDELFAKASAAVREREDLAEGQETLQGRLDLEAVIAGQKDVLAAGVDRSMARLTSIAASLHAMLVTQLAADRRSGVDQLDTLVRVHSAVTTAMPESGQRPFVDPLLDLVGRDLFPALAKASEEDVALGPVLEENGNAQNALLESAVSKAEEQREFRTLRTEWEVQQRDVLTSLESAMLSVALAALNNALAEDVAPRMTVKSYDGLRETVTNERIVVTDVYEQLEKMIRGRNEGSFGVAGPRGVGKTTLVQFFAGTPGVRSPDEEREGGRERLGVVVSAPVSYVPREFVLHLYAELCKRVLGEPDRSERRAAFPEPGPGLGIPRFATKNVLAAAGAAALTGGAGLLTVAVLNRLPWTWHVFADAGAALILLAALIGFPPQARSRAVFLRSPGIKIARRERAGAGWWAAASATVVAGLVLLYAGGGWRGGNVPFLAGAVLLALGLPAARIVRVISRNERPRSPGFEARLVQPWERLRELASDHLRRIRFQQSISLERSMAVKVGGAVGFDAGGKRGETWQERVQTYPELVADLRTFLTAAGEEYVVLVGVDELDKLRSHEDVEAFLNDIKAVFGASGCFFLVSVSEDAAAGFERRGVPFRDVFDSAFDDVISVQQLDLPCARKVLHGLLLGWTEPFVALCYVLSGGLPRDLRRVAREMLSHRDEADGIDLGRAALAMCCRELDARLRAVRHELMREPSDPAGVDLLTRLADLAPATATLADFRTWHDDLDAWASSAAQPAARLGAEVAALALLAATVLEFFTPDGCGDRVREAEKPGAGPKNLATLAVARRMLAQSAGISLACTRRFRAAWEL